MSASAYLRAHGIKVDAEGFVFGSTHAVSRVLRAHGLRDDRCAWVADGPVDIEALTVDLARELAEVLS